jgi:hypothetical protein
MDEELQLNLFSWDRVKVGEGFSALAGLNFAKAQVTFQNLLSTWRGHPDASLGLEMVATWADFLRGVETLQKRDAIAKWGTLVLKQLPAIPAGGTRARCSCPLWPAAGSRAGWS